MNMFCSIPDSSYNGNFTCFLKIHTVLIFLLVKFIILNVSRLLRYCCCVNSVATINNEGKEIHCVPTDRH